MGLETKTKVSDPVCDMVIDKHSAAGTSQYSGVDYWFCSTECRAKFEKSPREYYGNNKKK